MTTKSLQSLFEKASTLPQDLQERLSSQWLTQIDIITGVEPTDKLSDEEVARSLAAFKEMDELAKKTNAPDADFSRDSIYGGTFDDPR